MLKRCTKCGETKDILHFTRLGRSIDGYHQRCKLCTRAERNRNRRKRIGNRSDEDRRGLLRSYGLTPEKYDAMLKEQGSSCAICREANPSTVSGRWCIDHNHATGAVRGLLCNKCNAGLGNFRENPEVFFAALRYLEHHRQRLAG